MEHPEPLPEALGRENASLDLAAQWRRFGRFATLVAVLTSPAAFLIFHEVIGWSVWWSLVATLVEIAAFRGLVDVLVRLAIPWPSTFGVQEDRVLEQDVVARRRAWFWRGKYRLLLFLVVLGLVAYVVGTFLWGLLSEQRQETLALQSPQLLIYALTMPLLLVVNVVILFGPFILMAVSQIRSYEPGDADWGVRLDDVRGQAEAKEEVRRVVSLWESGEAFEQAGGKRERGLLLLGAPGTGKTMLSKAVATGFNCPFVSIPGSGFAGMFIGMDALTVRYLAWKAKRLAAKWGGQCIVFIDEIDAVGMRRASLGSGLGAAADPAPSITDVCFFGSNGSLTAGGDLVIESREWRDRLFAARAVSEPAVTPALLARLSGAVDRIVAPGMMGGGSLALNSLLVVMDGIGGPPFWRKFWISRLNTLLDASYIVPRRIGRRSLRLPRPRPAGGQIYFIGACNVPIESLDPALTRPGRMGRHVWFRTPTKDDRKDIFDLYLGKVAHDPDLDGPERRDELARITNGYAPAMIEQVCSMALTVAHHEGRPHFGWYDIVDAMTTIESGTAVDIEYTSDETRAVAIHEAGHAAVSYLLDERVEATRLSIRMRGSSLGHHYALEKEERFTRWQHEEMARMATTLGAMAAEWVFYGENGSGVSGDVQSATARAAIMVGAYAMAPERPELDGVFSDPGREVEAVDGIMKRFEGIGTRIMQRARTGGPFAADPVASVLGDPGKRAAVAQLLGQSYVAAYAIVQANREPVEKIAEVLVQRRELYGDEVGRLLADSGLVRPDVDLLSDEVWPKL